jgi:hypothetical protein
MKSDAILERLDRGDQGTFGRIVAGTFTCFTGELPWRDNAPSLSCVPAGTYRVIWTWSPRFRANKYRLVDVPARAGVLEHAANLMGDVALGLRAQLNGCIALGERLGWMDRQKALLVSQPAVRRFEEYMGRKPFTLEIRDGNR